jgi:hypothetical protein
LSKTLHLLTEIELTLEAPNFDSQEAQTQEERESKMLSAVYLSIQDVPPSPAEPEDVASFVTPPALEIPLDDVFDSKPDFIPQELTFL